MITLLLFLFGLFSFQTESISGKIRCKIYFDDEDTTISTFFILAKDALPEVNLLPTENNLKSQPEIELGTPIEYFGLKLYPLKLRLREKTPSPLELEIELKEKDEPSLPPSIWEALKGSVLNIKMVKKSEPGAYIIITCDAFYNDVLPLAKWKELKGYRTIVKRLSEFSPATSANIRSYIQSLWNSDSLKPEFVLLVGSADSIPSFRIPVFNETNLTDLPYGLMDNDIFPEILVGRIPASTRAQAIVAVKKIIEYEKNPLRGGNQWFKRALVIGANYPEFMTSPIPLKKRIREELLRIGYEVDTVYWGNSYNQTGLDVSNAINRGVIFVNYRGGDADPQQWIKPQFGITEVQNLSNGWKLPVITSIVCNTGRFNHPACLGNAFLTVGDTVNPKGAVAFYGSSSPNTHTRWNNSLDYGFYGGVIYDSICTLGALALRSKMELVKNFYSPEDQDTLAFYFYCYNILGDPSLALWTDVPETIIVSHPDILPLGNSSVTVRVLKSSQEPIANALVSLLKPNEVKKTAFTDSQGNATFTISATTYDTLFVTVSAPNYIPYTGYITFQSFVTYVGLLNYTIEDQNGNGDGRVNPGERFNLYLYLKNFGTQPANNVNCTISTSDTSFRLVQNQWSFGTIPPGQLSQGGPFILEAQRNIPNKYQVKLDAVVNASEGSYHWSFFIPVYAPTFSIDTILIQDGNNNILEPGENASLVVYIKNQGECGASNVTAKLRTRDRAINIVDSVSSFGNMDTNQVSSNGSHPFVIAVSPQIFPGRRVYCTIHVESENYVQDLPITLHIGIPTANSPLGPDEYGYYAYDNTDNHPEAPQFAWIEIDPAYGGSGTVLNLGPNDIQRVSLPFVFRFYGKAYNTISISSEGYVVMGETGSSDRYNWSLPSLSAPPAIIAPFWDDLNPQRGGCVSYYYDASRHIFIVEWSRVPSSRNVTDDSLGPIQTFQLILYDPTYYPTVSQDGPISFQYLSINNYDSYHKYATCGIQDDTKSIGLLYTYNNEYPPECAPIVSGRAIKITTNPPDTLQGLEESPLSFDFSFSTFISDKLELRIPESLKKDKLAVTIYNIEGQKIKSLPIEGLKSDAITVDVTNLEHGVYFLQLKGKRAYKTLKFVKIR